MSDKNLLKNFFEGNPAKNVRLMAAGGLLPLPPEEMLILLVRLARDPEEEIAREAAHTLKRWPEGETIAQMQSPRCDPEVLEHFAGSSSPAVQEAIILNPEAGGTVIAKLASSVPAPLLETILYNRVRLLDFPEILHNVKNNPAATPQILGQVQEIETEFFGSKQRSYTAVISEPELPVVQETLDLEGELAPEDLALEGLPVDPQEREAAILRRIAGMTVRQKMQLALMGTREARAVLVRDSNKEILRCVIQSPKLTINEVESFAAMRQISDDVLRSIGNSRTWTKSYTVAHNLARNPKTPPMISQRMLLRLLSKDLMMLSRDRGIPEAVRRGADRLLKQRIAHKTQPGG
jgi:hypothetical protein